MILATGVNFTNQFEQCANDTSIKQKAQKVLFFSTKATAEILENILGFSFYSEQYILAQFHQMLLPSKSFKKFFARVILLWRQICW
jgi:hypothetical protein